MAQDMAALVLFALAAMQLQADGARVQTGKLFERRHGRSGTPPDEAAGGAAQGQAAIGSGKRCNWGYATSGCGLSTEGKVLPREWHTCEGNDACAGQKQSPISFTKEIVIIDTWLPPLQAAWKTSTDCLFTNDGHTVSLLTPGAGSLEIGDLPIRLHGNIGGGMFDLLHINLRWGCTDAAGSEHLVDGRSFPLEMQMVHTQRGAASPSTTPGGLAVLSVMFEIADADNAALQPFVAAIGNTTGGTFFGTTSVPSFDVAALYPFQSIGNYLAYAGSLTTPGCFESVNWLIAGTPMTISQRQLSAIRLAEHSPGHPMTMNFRPVQALNGRRIWSSSALTLPLLAAAATPHALPSEGDHAARAAARAAAAAKKRQRERATVAAVQSAIAKRAPRRGSRGGRYKIKVE